MGKNQETAQKGRSLVAVELLRRGASHVETIMMGQQPQVIATVGDRVVRSRTKTRRSGDWFGSIAWGNPDDAEENMYWIFVDLSSAGAGAAYYVVPDRWLRESIHRHHQDYIDRHGGIRPKNPESDHHAITLDMLKRWKDRWDLLGIFGK